MQKLLLNEKGMSLVEVTVAAAVSIIIAMGVVKINETSQKGMQSIQEKSEISQFKNIVLGHITNSEKCVGSSFAANDWRAATGAAPLDGVYPPTANGNPLQTTVANISIRTATNPVVNTNITTAANNTLPWSTKWQADEIRLYNRDASGVCHLLVRASKKNTSNAGFGGDTKNIWIPMECDINGATGVIEACNGQNLVAEGVLQDNDGPSGGAITGIVPVIIGNDPQPDTGAVSESGLFVGDLAGTSTMVDVPWRAGVKDAISVPDNHAISLGNDLDAAIYYNGANTIFDGASLGNVGIGVLNPTSKLHVNGSIRANSNIVATGAVNSASVTAAGAINSATVSASGAINSASVTATGAINSSTLTTSGDILSNGDINVGAGGTVASPVIVSTSVFHTPTAWANNYYYYSDKRFKKNIKRLEKASEKLSNIKGVSYFMRKEEFPKMNFKDGKHIGLIAQNVEKYFPELVVTNPNTGKKAVQYANFVAILIEVFKEQKIQIADNKKMLEVMTNGVSKINNEQNSRISILEEENKKLKSIILDLSQRIDALEKEK